MEIDLYWFDQAAPQRSVDEFWARFEPLYRGVEGYKGVILNVGWTVGYIMEWSGDLQQKITLPHGTGEQPWVAEESPLPGTSADRLREWKQRFSNPELVKRQGYGPWTYGDLKQLAEKLRTGAEQRGIHNFRVGSLAYAWNNAYGEEVPWAKRHPEAFTRWRIDKGGAFDTGSFFDPAAVLHADTAKLGGLPHGIVEGMPVHRAFAAQWGSLSRAVGLDALMLRDSFGFPVPYERGGPKGPVMPSAEDIRRATGNVSDLVRETKQANPRALLMMYSNGASAIGDWRSNGLDLEKIAEEGYLDIFVDQTWAGAWNEVGVRHDLFWNSPTLGWTYQLAYMLMHGAMLAKTKVRHYPLVETFDAWESWDVLHTVPQRLLWGIWAYSHAGVKTPHGIVMPQGSYISWANQGKRLLSGEDVKFLRTHLSAAVSDAADTKEIYGPTLVYSRSAMKWQTDHAQPYTDVKEWIDEQAGSVIKWPVPVLSSTRIEWLSSTRADLAVVQTPAHLSPEEFAILCKRIEDGRPTAIFGSFTGGVDSRLLNFVGLPSFTTTETKATVHQANLVEPYVLDIKHIPLSFPILEKLDTQVNKATIMQNRAAQVIYETDGNPALLIEQNLSRELVLWDPPEFSGGCCRPLGEIWGGSAAPYALAAASLNELLKDAGDLHAGAIDMDQTGTVAAWRTLDGKLHLLAGNLEEGLREDAEHSRHVSLVLPVAWRTLLWTSAWDQRVVKVDSAGVLQVELPPEGSLLLEASSL